MGLTKIKYLEKQIERQEFLRENLATKVAVKDVRIIKLKEKLFNEKEKLKD